MKDAMTIETLFSGNRIQVPTYQRAYAWETEWENSKPPKQVNTFVQDLDEYIESQSPAPYYFGHFLFEEKGNNEFNVIDGQQRMTTIVIFVAALFKHLFKLKNVNKIEKLDNEYIRIYEAIVKNDHMPVFSTVDYDEHIFEECIIEQRKSPDLQEIDRLETESSKRFIQAFNYFLHCFNDKTEDELKAYLNAIKNARCTTYIVQDESEAIQMFIFQNNRGKKPTLLEIIKAQFMYHIHLYTSGNKKQALIKELNNRFENIYKNIAQIERKFKEDDILKYTVYYHFNKLWSDSLQKDINSKLKGKEESIKFIRDFTYDLEFSFKSLKEFTDDGKFVKNYEIYSLMILGNIGVIMPFILKAYFFNLSSKDRKTLYAALENIMLRSRLIQTRAELESRINDVYAEFTKDNPKIDPIIERIEFLKNCNEYWWCYWNNNAFDEALKYGIYPKTAKYLLWKYENSLHQNKGYELFDYRNIKSPELGHIAPKTKNNEPITNGYPDYDDNFKRKYLNCLGNYLLISKSDNCSIGNKKFTDKRASYRTSPLYQQREVYEMTETEQKWTIDLIQIRHKKIQEFILDYFG